MMRRLHPMCPRCDDEFLYVVRSKDYARLLCRECGWSHTFMPPPREDELDAAIAAAVDAAKESKA